MFFIASRRSDIPHSIFLLRLNSSSAIAELTRKRKGSYYGTSEKTYELMGIRPSDVTLDDSTTKIAADKVAAG